MRATEVAINPPVILSVHKGILTPSIGDNYALWGHIISLGEYKLSARNSPTRRADNDLV